MTSGLTDEEVKESRKKYGSNAISKKNNNSFWHLLIESLGDPIIKILLIALAIKVVFLFKDFDWYETLGILIAILLASFISSISEYGSNKAFDRLQKENQLLKTKVIRNNTLQEIYVKDVVVDDLIKVTSGERIPADGIMIKGNLSLDESFMTGETKEVYKRANDKDKNFVYGGSVIYKGEALIKITQVGDKSYLGSISNQIQDQNEVSPLKNKLQVFAKQISKLGYFGALCASLAYLFIQIFVNNHFNWTLILNTVLDFKLMFSYFLYCLTLSVTIIIMAVPEGLPMMITLVLSSNMKKMLKDNVLVRKLVGIETAGSLNILLCDKTGTLTEGKIKVHSICTKKGNTLSDLNEIKKYPHYYQVLRESLYLNNEAELADDNVIGGNTSDQAIMKFIKDDPVNKKIIKRENFSSETKYSCVTCEDNKVYYKGASEVLLPKCQKYLDLDGTVNDFTNKEEFDSLLKNYTSKGYRVIVNAYQENDYLVFISLIILSDTVRKEAYDSLKLIKEAGIKVIMITGDAKETAECIGSELHIIEPGDYILTHDEIKMMSDNKLAQISPHIAIIARALPEDKSRLVSIYKQQGLVVGMTGDGVNDALALKKSDVGFALGSGCEVAKESSDIVILDNNIMSISKAILYGRTIFKSIRKFIIYQSTVNVCALFLSIVGTLIGISTPITIIQMLWLNMIMDTFAGLAFSYEPPLKEYMREKPKKREEKILNHYMLNQIVINGLFSSLICIILIKVPFINEHFRTGLNDKYLLTAFFALFIFLGIFNSFLSRTHCLNIFNNILKNKVFIIINCLIFIVQIYIIYWGGDLFRTYGLTLKEILLVFGMAMLIFPVDLIRKYILKKKKVKLGV